MLRSKVKIFISTFLFIPMAFAIGKTQLFQYQSTQPFIEPINISDKVFSHFSFQNGAITFRVKLIGKPQNIIVSSLVGFSFPDKDKTYASFYISRSKGHDKFGLEIRDDQLGHLIPNDKLAITLPYSEEFQTITYNFHHNKIEIYINKKKVKVIKNAYFLKKLPNYTSIYQGKTNRHTLSHWKFVGEYYYLDIHNRALTEKQIIKKHITINETHQKDLKVDFYKQAIFGAHKSVTQTLFASGQKNAKNYRIPSLITTKNGVIIAAIDKRNQHSLDWGNIDTVIRRSFDGGHTWEDDQIVIDLASQPYGVENSAFVMDPVIVQDQTSGRIFMFVDMFPETKGFFSLAKDSSSEGSGYQYINDKPYLVLTDKEKNQFTVREKGIIYDKNNVMTSYKVIIKGNPKIHFKDLGDLYYKKQRIGNIFLNSNKINNDSGLFTIKPTNYLWLTYSDDDGKTWSSPIDITPQIKEEWMRFLGTGPGRGIQLKNGNLAIPVYYTNQNNKQSSALIISKDHGKTWQRGKSPLDNTLSHKGGSRYLNNSSDELTESQLIELANGEIKLFSRSHKGNVQISTSKDGGYSWENTISDTILLDPYAQMSVIKYSRKINNKEYVLFSNPHSINDSRVNGKIWLGEVQDNGNILWKSNITINTGNYAYSCLTELANGDIGLIYEEDAENIKYLQFNLEEFFWQKNIIINK